MMNRTLQMASLSMLLGSPLAPAQSELESLRARSLEQERQIRQLEEENSRLRGESPAPTPAPSPAPAATPLPDLVEVEPSATVSAPSQAGGVYIVKPGDSLQKIASKTGVPTQTLLQLNGLKPNAMIHPGQKFKLPAKASTPQSSAPAAPISAPTDGRTHEVQKGDTFFSIAKKYGMSTADLIAANPDAKPSALRLGQKIQLGKPATPSTPAAPTETSPSPTTPEATPAPQPASSSSAKPDARPEKPVTVMVESEMNYADFAAKYGTDTGRLNSLNGLDLEPTTILAKGSELYVPTAVTPEAADASQR
jgi:LysM repeat protein